MKILQHGYTYYAGSGQLQCPECNSNQIIHKIKREPETKNQKYLHCTCSCGCVFVIEKNEKK